MQEQILYNQADIDTTNERVNNLLVSLKFIDACFNHLPYPKANKRSYSLTYYYSNTLEFIYIDELITELKRCINYQVGSGKEISISADINIRQKVIIEQQELELFYYGQLNLSGLAGRVQYCWYQSTPFVSIDLQEPTTGKMILSLFNNFQNAISDQIQKYK